MMGGRGDQMSEMVKEHLINIINALTNLSPSRNIITQFILLLPKDSATVEHSYPELITSEAKKVLEHLGVDFGDAVKRSNDFSGHVYSLVHRIFDWLDDEEVRSALVKLTGMSIDSIPNPYEEWAKLVLKKLLEKPIGEKVIEFLKMLIDRSHFIVERRGYSRGATKPNWRPFLEEARNKLKVNPAEFKEILKLTVGESPELINVDYGSEDRQYSYTKREIRKYILHSEYHLDLILRKESKTKSTYYGVYSSSHEWYDCEYILRYHHKNTLKKVLDEVLACKTD